MCELIFGGALGGRIAFSGGVDVVYDEFWGVGGGISLEHGALLNIGGGVFVVV